MALPATTYDTATLVNPGSSLTDFTLIVDLSRMSAAWWTAVDTSDGTKGRAAKDSGPTELACDWIDFDSVNETGLLRVKWSGTLASSGTQTLRVYPPQAANASVAASATYGSDNAYDSDWTVYWPMEAGSGTTETDRTSNGFDGTLTGTPTSPWVSGKVGGALDLTGDFSAVMSTALDSGLLPGTGPFTVICWGQKPTNGDAYWGISNGLFSLYTISSGNLRLDGISSNLETTLASGTSHIAVVRDASGRAIYINGSSVATDAQTGEDASSNGYFVGGAISISGQRSMENGWVDDLQFHLTDRSSAWIEHEYEQTNDQATFWGTWTNVPVAAGISIPVVMHHRRMMGVS